MSQTKHTPDTVDESWKDRREFAVWANAPDGTRHRYCLPTNYHSAERTAKELRHNGGTEIAIIDFNAIDDLLDACRAAVAEIWDGESLGCRDALSASVIRDKCQAAIVKAEVRS